MTNALLEESGAPDDIVSGAEAMEEAGMEPLAAIWIPEEDEDERREEEGEQEEEETWGDLGAGDQDEFLPVVRKMRKRTGDDDSAFDSAGIGAVKVCVKEATKS